MSAHDYELGLVFAVRMAGVPFDVLLQLATEDAFACARDVDRASEAVAVAARAASAELDTLGSALGGRVMKRLRRDLREGMQVPEELWAAAQRESGRELPAVQAYRAAAAARAETYARLDEALAGGYARAAGQTIDSALAHLPAYAVFSSGALGEELERLAGERGHAQLTSKARNAVEHLALYLQRVCAKTDTISRYGPVGWGRLVDGDALRIDPAPGVQVRRAFLERWVARSLAAAIDADPRVRAELAPRVHPDGALDGDAFVRFDLGSRVPLSAPERELLGRCDGTTPAHALDAPALLEALAARGVVIWRVELIAMDTQPVHTLLADIRRWRAGDARQHWESVLERLVASCAELESEVEPRARVAILERTRVQLQDLGAALPVPSRALYAARNPIVEECFRECGIELGRALVDRFMSDAAPWLDLWRDTYSFAASHAFGALAELYQTAPRHGDAVVLPAFLAHCEQHGKNLRGPALAQLAAEAYQQVKADLRDTLAGRADAPEWELRPEDCHVVRRRHTFPLVDEMSWPSADLLLSARSLEAVARGDYRWVIGELHHGGPLFQHCFYWSCPDRATVRRFARRLLAGRPWCAHSHGHFELPVHISSEPAMDAWTDAVFVGSERGHPSWRSVAPADAIVAIDDERRDLRVRHRATGEDLGSLVHQLFVCMGFHPFFPLGIAPHTPRLRIGNVVVQRRTWYVAREELGGPFRGLSRELVIAIERLRAARSLPRWVYVRPSAAGLQRSNFTARDKDLKPIYVDLESYIFASVFAQRLEKYTELEVVEMLPDFDHLIWQEPDGRRAFELRTMVYSSRELALAMPDSR